MKRGRKSLFEEIKIVQRFQELTPKYFKILNNQLDCNLISEQKWAVEQLTKAYSRMIPQNLDITSKGKTIGQLIDELHGVNSNTKKTSRK